jgi:hypothetical protein
MAGGGKEARKLRLKIPNAKKLYSEEDIIYGKSDGYYRPHHPVLSFAKSAVGEAIVKNVVPHYTGKGNILGEAWNAHWRGIEKDYNAGKHIAASQAFNNEVPILNKFVQNYWSLYHLKDGLTTIDSVYTVERGGNEYFFNIRSDGQKEEKSKIITLADQAKGQEESLHGQVLNDVASKKYEDIESTNAGVYKELTSGDIAARGLLDINKVSSKYQLAELIFIKNAGTKSLVGKTSDGASVHRYSKPSASEFLRFYTHMDVVYTVLSAAAAPAELLLTDQALQSVYEMQTDYAINTVLGNYVNGKIRKAA